MQTNYERIEKALRFISENSVKQPSLDQIASHVNLSPFHFQRLFVEWAGISPKEFLSYCTLSRAKDLLSDPASRIIDVSEKVGLSSVSRLHELFVKIEAMSPVVFRDCKVERTMSYTIQDSVFGKYIVVSTTKGISYLAFVQESIETELQRVRLLYPGAVLKEESNEFHFALQELLQGKTKESSSIKLHLAASPFRVKVWEALLRIPAGKVCTYAELARAIGSPGSARAVGNAVASNPVAYLIPCHRVIQSTGVVGNYMWGADRKKILLAWEAFKNS